MDKLAIKSALEEMIREHNPELQGFLEDILAKYLIASSISDRSIPLDMAVIRQKYALRRDAFAPLHDLFKDALPASELVKSRHR